MPGPKRSRRERTDEWASIQRWTLWPEQELYEQIRPIVLFGETPGERAKEIDAAQRTLSRKADEFEHYGMRSLFSTPKPREEGETERSLPAEMRQLIVDVHAELPSMSAARNCRGVLHSLRQEAFASQCQTHRVFRSSSLPQSQALSTLGDEP